MKKIFTIVLVLLAVACSAQQKTVMDYATETVPVFGDYLYLIKSGTTDRKTTKAYFQQNVLSGTQYQIPVTNAGADGFDHSSGLTYTGSIFYVSGNFGVGKVTPDYIFHIAKEGSASASAPRIKIENTHSSVDVGNDFGGIQFYANDISGGGTGISGYIKNVAVDAGVTSRMEFGTRSSGDATTGMALDYNGRVGIGTITPTEELDVEGDASVTRLFIANANTRIDTVGTKLRLTDADVGSYTLDQLKGIAGINVQTGTTYTLALTDLNKLVTLDNAAAITLTVPPNSGVAFDVEDQISIVGLGAGQVTIAEGSGVTIIAADSKDKLRVLGSTATLIKLETDTWLLTGDIAL